MKFSLRFPLVADVQQQANNEGLVADVNGLAQFFSAGEGAPSSSPDGPQLYFRRDGAAGSSAYGWDGSSWTALW